MPQCSCGVIDAVDRDDRRYASPLRQEYRKTEHFRTQAVRIVLQKLVAYRYVRFRKAIHEETLAQLDEQVTPQSRSG